MGNWGVIMKYKKEIIIIRQEIKKNNIVSHIIGIICGIKKYYLKIITLNWQFNIMKLTNFLI